MIGRAQAARATSRGVDGHTHPYDEISGTPTLESGWAAYGGPSYAIPIVVSTGLMVVMQGLIKRTSTLAVTAESHYQVATVPAGWRPADRVVGQTHIRLAATAQSSRLDVNRDGDVFLVPYASATFAIDEWVSLNLTWGTL